jgi:hypothetical protein
LDIGPQAILRPKSQPVKGLRARARAGQAAWQPLAAS